MQHAASPRRASAPGPRRHAPSATSPAPAAAPAPPPSPSLPRHRDAPLFDALVSHCGATTTLAVGEGPRGRGLFSPAAAREGDVLLSVPLSNCLVVSTGGSAALVGDLLRGCGAPAELAKAVQKKSLPPDARLAALLLWAVDNHRSWRDAAALLPAADFSVPAALGDEAASAARAAVAPLLDAASPERLAWALSCVLSRSFEADAWTRSNPDGKLALSVPLADLANHSQNPAASFRLRSATNAFELYACRPIRAGEEVCVSYGEDMANDEMTHRYGFVLANNPNGEVTKKPVSRLWSHMTGN